MRTPFYLLALLSAVLVAAEEKPCTIHGNGNYYDLNPLKANKDRQITGLSNNKDIFAINMCQEVRTETFGVKDDIRANEIAAFIRRGRGDFVLGKVNTTLDFYHDHPRLVLSGGSRCKSTRDEPQEIRASAIVDFICDPTVLTQGRVNLVAQLPPGNEDEGCAYVLEWRTPFACATSEGWTLWSVVVTLAVVFLVLLLTYTILGALYNRYVLQLRGVDQIPQFSWESMKYHATEAFDWARDVLAYYQPHPNGSGGLYRAPTATNPVSHQTGVGIDIRQDPGDLESRGGPTHFNNQLFSRPQPRSATSASSNSTPFSRAPQRPVETNPVSHQTQVNAELEHQRLQSLSQRPSIPSQLSSPDNSSPSSTSSSHRGPLVTVSQSPSPTPLQKPTPVPAKSSAAAANLFASRPTHPTPATAYRDFNIGDDDGDGDEDEDDDEQDYNEYNMANEGDVKELNDFKPGGSSATTPNAPKQHRP